MKKETKPEEMYHLHRVMNTYYDVSPVVFQITVAGEGEKVLFSLAVEMMTGTGLIV